MLRSRCSRLASAPLARVAAALLALPLLGAGACNLHGVTLGLPTPDGVMPVAIELAAGIDPASVRVTLDDTDVTAQFEPGGPGLVGSLPVPTPGSHQIRVRRPLSLQPASWLSNGLLFESPSAAPAVVSIEPLPESDAVPRGAWLRFRLAEPASASDVAGFGFGIECDGVRVPRDAHALDDGTLVLNPSPALPAGAACRVAWRGNDGSIADTSFTVAPDAAGDPAVALYDRTGPLSISPFPDDYWLVDDPGQPTGKRVDLPDPPFVDVLQRQAFSALAGLVSDADGWSRQTPIVIGLSHALDPSMIPANPVESMDPSSPIALIDVDPASPQFGERIPYRLLARSDPWPAPSGSLHHAAIVFPTIDLREQGRYAMVFTRQAFAAGEPGRSFGPALLFETVLGPPSDGEDAEAERVRSAVGDALEVVETLGDVPIPREDIALALSISIRTHPSVDDLVYLKELALASPPPELVLPDVAVDPCPTPGSFCIRLIGNRAVEARGFVRLPRFRDLATKVFARDPVTGLPQQLGLDDVPLVFTLPRAALDGPVFPLMYQHGNPGSPNELLGSNSEQIDNAGLALAGFQDSLNRDIGQNVENQVLAIFFDLVLNRKMPEYWLQTGTDQIFFLRAIQGMASLDLLHAGPGGEPALGPDGVPEIDPSTILYKGISEGGNNAQRFLPFAPEILAAEATVGGARLGETLIHQSADQILLQIGGIMQDLRPVDLWVGLSLFQAGFDPQDGHTYLRHLYREPLLPFAGSSDVTPPSTIWTEGIGDSLVPNNASRAMAAELGVPHVRPVAVEVPGLEQVDAPLAGNIAPGITAGYFQFDPFTTPSCVAIGQFEGHYCPQSGAEPKAQRLHFLLTALDGEAEIIDPF